MASCFLSYSNSYGHLKEPFRRLLEELGFKVDIFDGPDSGQRPSDIVQERILKADAVLVLLGPSKRASGDQEVVDAAEWPADEAIFALKEKPVALIVHRGTRVPELLRDSQTFPAFDFWDANTFVANVHHIVKHITDLKKLVDLPGGAPPFRVTDCVMRSRIQLPGGTLCFEAYRKVIVRQPVSVFSHGFHTNYDDTADVDFTRLTSDSYEVDVHEGAHRHSAEITPGRVEKHELKYFVKVTPPLEAEEVFGYRTRFTLPNFYPTTRSELVRRSRQEGYTQLFPEGFYGDSYTVRSDMHSLTLALHLPRRLKLSDHKLLVINAQSEEKNELEMKRCSQFLRTIDNPDSFERIIEVKITGPIVNHGYYLLYEPGD